MLDRVGHVGDQRRGLGVDLARLQAEAAVDAVRAVAEAAVGDADRADAHLDAQLARPAPRLFGAAGDRVRPMRVAVRIAPRPVLTGDRQLELEALVVGLEVGVGDRPVLRHAVARAHLEVRRVKARAVAGIVDHRAADAVAGVVLAQLDGILAADYALVRPVELVRAGLVGDPIGVGIPERPTLEDDHAPAAARQALSERAAARAAADDQQVDRVVGRIAAHALGGHRAPVDVEQEGRVVVGRPQRALGQNPQLVLHGRPWASTSLTASTSASFAAAPSQLSRWPVARRT